MCGDFHLVVGFTENLIEPHSQRWNKVLISEYDFAVNVIKIISIGIHNDLVNKLLIAKISLVRRTSM